MTTETIARPPFGARLPRLRFGALFEAWVARDAYLRQVHQLRLLDDRMLRDIGITREDLGVRRL